MQTTDFNQPSIVHRAGTPLEQQIQGTGLPKILAASARGRTGSAAAPEEMLQVSNNMRITKLRDLARLNVNVNVNVRAGGIYTPWCGPGEGGPQVIAMLSSE